MSIKIPHQLHLELITSVFKNDPNERRVPLLGNGDDVVEVHRVSEINERSVGRYTIMCGDLA